MQDTKEYLVAPKLTHHLIGIVLTGGIASVCTYMAITNATGILTRETDLSAETVTMILWVLGAVAGLISLLFIAELVVTQRRPVSKIRLMPSAFSIPMNTLLKQRTMCASYADITQVVVHLSAPNRLLRIHTSAASGTVAELNVDAGMFDDIHATLVQRTPHLRALVRKPSALG